MTTGVKEIPTGDRRRYGSNAGTAEVKNNTASSVWPRVRVKACSERIEQTAQVFESVCVLVTVP